MILRVAVLVLALLPVCCSAGESKVSERTLSEPAIPHAPRSYVCARAEASPVIDGRLDDPAWGAAPWTEDFLDIEGQEKPKPRFRTRAKLLWDDRHLYIGADLTEPHVWGTLTERDAVVFHDNDFEVFLDPDGDTHGYFELEMNALGTEWDLYLVKPYRDGGPALEGWDIRGLRTAVHVDGTLNDPSDTDGGWTVEIAIPWRALGDPRRQEAPRPGERWRMNLSRVEWRVTTDGGRYAKVEGAGEDNWVWSPQGLVNMHYPEMWGYVQFSERADAEFVPDPGAEEAWFLRRVYYRQRNRFARRGEFAGDVSSLGLNPPRDRRFSLHRTPGLFEASIETGAGERLTIGRDGRLARGR